MDSDLLRFIAEGATVVTPNRRLARDLKRRFDIDQSTAGRAVWPTPDILPLSTWLERSFADLMRFDPSQRLLSPTQELALWQQAVADSPYASALLDTAATARTAHQAWRLQHGWRLDLSAVGIALPEDAKAFSAWSARFREVCAVRRWLDGARLADAVSERLHLDRVDPPRGITWYGFDEPSPQERDLLKTCRAAGMRAEERYPDRSPGKAVVRAYVSSQDELADVARRARDILTGDRAARIGVVVPDLARRRSDVVRLFDDVLEPGRVLPGARVRPRPYNVSLGLPLSRYPLIHAALSILRLVRGQLPLDEVGSLVRSPFIAGGEQEFTRRARLDARLRHKGWLEVSVESLHVEAHAPNHDDPHACRALSARLEAWRPLALDARSLRQAPSAWSSTFLALLSGLGWPGERTLDSEDYQTFQKWRELVSGLAVLDPMLGSLRYDDAVSWLARLSAETLFQPETEDVPIQVLGVLESAAIEFDHLFVTGLHDEVWPEAARPNPLLPIALQRARGVPHASTDWELGFARRMTALWLRGAGHIAFSHPTSDGDRALRRSPLLADVPVERIPVAAVDTSSAPSVEPTYAEALRGAVRLERLTDATAPALVPGHRVAGGAAVFGDQSACPFRAFAIHRLGARGLERGHPGLDARERGKLLHRAVAQLWGDLESKARLLAMDDDDLRAAIGLAVAAAVQWLQRSRPDVLSGAFAAIERKRLGALLARLLELEKRRAAFRVVHLEEPRELDVVGLTVSARIDRIDVLDDGSRVIIDYKTGSASVSEWIGERPDDPQLPLYSVTDPGPVAAVSFAVLRAEEVAFKGLAREPSLLPEVATLDLTKTTRHIPDWDNLFITWRSELERLAGEFLAGHAAVVPKDYPQTCEYCQLGTLCRVRESLDRGPAPDDADD